MADYTELKAAIRAAIFDNTDQSITGQVLQDILLEMVVELGQSYVLPQEGIPDTDLAQAVRNALAAGLSAYQKPASGIPETDLAQAVRDALAAALSAYQKPSTGIPAADMADGVIPDVSQFITKTVNDLVNYYKKSETYTQAQVNALIGAINQFKFDIYASLGDVTAPASNVLYLIGPTGSGADKYEEYVYASGAFTKIGDTSIDLSGYVTLTDLNTALADYALASAIPTALSQLSQDSTHRLVTDTEKTTWNGKYSKPQGGIPKTDMASGVKTSLGKADSAVQPSGIADFITLADLQQYAETWTFTLEDDTTVTKRIIVLPTV